MQISTKKSISKSIDYLILIPARSGSKRIKNKNLVIFNKKPLLYWTIKEAKKINLNSLLAISSNSSKILGYAKKNGIDHLIKRPAKLANDKASTWEVVRHSINVLKKKKILFKNILLLQPTSPLRKKKHIINSIKFFEKKKLDGVISVTKISKPLSWFFSSGKNISFYDKLKYKKFFDKNKKFQDIVPNGAIYIFKIDKLKKKNFIYQKKVMGFLMNEKISIDIDNKKDLELAKFYSKL